MQITVSADGISIDAAGGSLHASRNGSELTISYQHGGSASPVSGVQSSVSALELGAVPWALGGHWTLSTVPADPAWGCDLDLASSAIGGQCRNAAPPVWFPYLWNRQATCSKTAARTSLFGDLGGVWSCDAPSGAHCDITFDGSSIESSCAPAERMDGTMKATFDGSTVSGSTSRGYEFAAHRVQ